MEEKKDYLLTYDEIDLRRAKKNDNSEEIAKLIYQTDPYIYPFLFKDGVEEAKKSITKIYSRAEFYL